jgi:hypothetical protein
MKRRRRRWQPQLEQNLRHIARAPREKGALIGE